MELKNAFADELADILHAEKQLVKALPRLSKVVTSKDLRQALESHLEQTQNQIQRLEQVFGTISKRVAAKKCAGMEGILAEATRLLQQHNGKKSRVKKTESPVTTESATTSETNSTIPPWFRSHGPRAATRNCFPRWSSQSS